MPNIKKQAQRAFTLVEMLVVLAIIGILSSMIFPSLSRAREGGRRASCTSNLRQIGMAISMYVEDFDERYLLMSNTTPMAVPKPIPAGCSETVDVPVPWSFPLLSYAKSNALFVCPSVAEPAEKVHDAIPVIPLWDDCTPPPPSNSGPGGGGGGGGGGISNCPVPDPPSSPLPSYAINTMMHHESAWNHTEELKLGQGFAQSVVVSTKCNVPPSAPGTTWGKLEHPLGVLAAAVTKPSETILMADAEDHEGKAPFTVNFTGDLQLDYPSTATVEDKVDVDLFLAKRHMGGYNALFADGHVKFLPYGTSRPQLWTVEDD